MIYAIQEAETGFIKIGVARDEYIARRQRLPAIARARRKEKNRTCTLKLIRWADWPPDVEMLIHRYLWQTWIEGEWFESGERVDQVLELMKSKTAYFQFMRDFRAAQATLPGPWYWKNRDRIIKNHRAAHASALI